MNSIFCKYSSLEPAIIQEVVNVFKDGDKIDMQQVEVALQEMCPANDRQLPRAVTSPRQNELVDVTSPHPASAQPPDACTPSTSQSPNNHAHASQNSDVPGYQGTQCYDAVSPALEKEGEICQAVAYLCSYSAHL